MSRTQPSRAFPINIFSMRSSATKRFRRNLAAGVRVTPQLVRRVPCGAVSVRANLSEPESRRERRAAGPARDGPRAQVANDRQSLPNVAVCLPLLICVEHRLGFGLHTRSPFALLSNASVNGRSSVNRRPQAFAPRPGRARASVRLTIPRPSCVRPEISCPRRIAAPPKRDAQRPSPRRRAPCPLGSSDPSKRRHALDSGRWASPKRSKRESGRRGRRSCRS